MARHKMVCARCGSKEVLRDAWAEWDERAQEWTLQNVFDAAYCEACDGDCKIDMVELTAEEDAELGVDRE